MTTTPEQRRRQQAAAILAAERHYPGPLAGPDVERLPYTLAKKACTYGEGICVNPRHEEPVNAIARSWLCLRCETQIGKDLREIAESWPFLESSLRPGINGPGNGSSGTRTAGPAPVDVDVIDIMSAARDTIADLVRHLIEDRPAQKMPADQSTPGFAHWLAKWQLTYISTHPDDSFPASVPLDLAVIVQLIRRKTDPSGARRIPVEAKCTWPDADGSGTLCGGDLYAIVVDQTEGRTSAVRCMSDPAHIVNQFSWLEMLHAKQAREAAAKDTSRKETARR